ncbi:MAG: alanine dehydrogenase [Gammaproteobacteria bacterium]|nr:alanine dehydrogenase [Gammaproteobacteria bacterium]
MLKTILRKEHKNKWERRTPLCPSAIDNLIDYGFPVDVEVSDVRIFGDESYQSIDAVTFSTPDNHQLIIGIKEPPIDSIKPSQVHLCFSHTIKGQEYNMPLLQRFIDNQATLFDYELMADENGIRTIAFGEYAGIAGAIDSFWIAGQKLILKAESSPLSEVKQTIHYETIDNVKRALSKINLQEGKAIRILIIGNGNVGRGAEKVCKWLNLPQLSAEKFLDNQLLEGSWYTVLNCEDIHQRIDAGKFDWDEYIEKGKAFYRSKIESLLGRFDILIQASFWTDFYPRHLDNQQLIKNEQQLPWVIGDISCDIDGSFVCTQKASSIDQPAFSYDPTDGSMTDGISRDDMTVMSIDNLPCELSLDASEHFSQKLEEYTPHLMGMNLTKPFNELALPDEIKRAVIVYNGELTENFQYLNDYL